MRRGDLYAYQAISRTRTVLIVSADELTAAGRPIVIDVSDVAPTGVRSLLAVPIAGHGHALVYRITDVDPARLIEHLGVADPAAMDAISMSLSVALGL
ncbi:type II toxin-antitoxin system PemK/MazF family toxin [Nocardia sp. NPDC051756]|uniref:type II toxin-antitoxin system PemK/MazF family toxin n=1 Tax=Nocardia sp. NPDC051756 TaxID=3154751 RepID=UPI0034453AF1